MNFKKSFTLIELLIVIFVLTVGIIGVISMFPMGIQTGKSAQIATVATSLNQGKIEEIIFKSYGEISVGSTTEAYGEISNFEFYKRVTEVNYYDPVNSTVIDSDSGIKRIEVTVFWQSSLGGSEKNINIVSLISKR